MSPTHQLVLLDNGVKSWFLKVKIGIRVRFNVFSSSHSMKVLTSVVILYFVEILFMCDL